jgi:mannitol 2-dehydrogenase
MAIRVAQSNLDAIGALGISLPRYDRSALAPRILHLGVGGFHRSHMALYTDELAAGGSDWAIRGVGLLEADRHMAESLHGQDHLYTLIERDSDGAEVRVIGASSTTSWRLATSKSSLGCWRIPNLRSFR